MFCLHCFTDNENDILRCLQKLNSSYKSSNPQVRTVVFYSQFFQSLSLQTRASHIKSLFSFVCSLDLPCWKLIWEQTFHVPTSVQGGLTLTEVFWVFHVRSYILNYEQEIVFVCGLQIHVGKALTFLSKTARIFRIWYCGTATDRKSTQCGGMIFKPEHLILLL